MLHILYILSFLHLLLAAYSEHNISSGEDSQIKNFTEFLENSLNRTVLEYTLKSLTKPGDNFGAVLRSVVLKVGCKDNGSIENNIRNLVIKTPVTNPFLAEFFKPTVTFVKEVHFYSEIIPALEQFEEIANVPREERLDAFQRKNIHISNFKDAEYADSDAILLLENVKFKSFINGDKRIGFNTNETLATLKVLAKFHALCIAMRRLEPTLYNRKIDPFMKSLDRMKEIGSPVNEFIYSEMKLVLNLSAEASTAIESIFAKDEKYNKTIATDTPYTTVVHNYLWINNIMIRKGTLK
ncbi:uncharacterized protein LOC116337236 [Contarinia nasturtii]|uniref:uncharacterized protein LOC116337236 n=1 Tax=Contarinia nasturtii TaxID=265458 RepID=UPI0012D3F653|nr:uncharacterized protein LOC116337236 [Contarinia nasturtii]